jgi:hydrogenase nickel incorporation protein HypA/HybF
LHEAAITRSMLDAALAAARAAHASRISRIRLLVGEDAAVVPECVQSYFEQLRVGTEAATAVLEFRTAPLLIRCPKCRAEFGRLADMCACNAGGEVLSGQELVVESIEVD